MPDALVALGVEVEFSYLDAGDYFLAPGGLVVRKASDDLHRSVNCGGVRLRAEGKQAAGVETLMARIVQLPILEAEVEQLRAEIAKLRERSTVTREREH